MSTSIPSQNKTCRVCKSSKFFDEFRRSPSFKLGIKNICKICENEQKSASHKKRKSLLGQPYIDAINDRLNRARRKRRSEDPVGQWCVVALHGSRDRARKEGCANTLTRSYIASIAKPNCAIFNVPLNYNAQTGGGPDDMSPTVDRIDPALGYVPGNVQVVCFKANRAKNNCNLEEQCKIYIWWEAALRQNIANDKHTIP